MKKTFVIEYSCYDKHNVLIKNGVFKVKNKESEFEAKCSFENFLIMKYPNFGRLIITSCKNDDIFNQMFGSNPYGSKTNDIGKTFGDIFGFKK